MRLKLAFVRPGGPTRNVVVTTEANAAVGDIAQALVLRDPAGGRRQRSQPLTLTVSPPEGGPGVTVPAERAVGETAIASGSEITVVPAHVTPAPAGGRPSAAVMNVLSGPESGRVVQLPLGTTTIGRDPACDVVLTDRFVSKRHVRVEIGHELEIIDLNSANGINVDGVTVTRVTALPGQAIQLGDTRLSFTMIAAQAAPPQEAQGGAIAFNRSPRVEERYDDREHPRPSVPSEQTTEPFPWLLMIAPILMGIGMFAYTGRPITLMFTVMTPLMMLGNFITTRGRTKRQLESSIAKFTDQLAILRTTLERELIAEKAVRQGEVPPVSEVFAAGLQRSATLWTRRPEHWSFLHLRLGVGRLPSRNVLAPQVPNDDGLPEYAEQLTRVEDDFRFVDDVPVLEDLLTAGALGVVGTRTTATDVTRGILLQLAGLHSPAEVVITAMASPDDVADYAWMSWLPHTSSAHSPISGSHLANSAATAAQLAAQLEELITQRSGRAMELVGKGALSSQLKASGAGGRIGETKAGEAEDSTLPSPIVVLLVANGALVDRGRLVQISERAAEAGVIPIWIANDPADLPAVCRTFVDARNGLGQASVHFVRHGKVIPSRVEGVSADHALTFARALAPLADSGALESDDSDIPRQVSVVSLLGLELVTSGTAVVERWRENESMRATESGQRKRRRTRGLRAMIGQSGVDAVHLDLRTQGPHALVGGTTGSGKSEFLQAWVLGMAAEFSPDRVTFLFVDYKGGSAFAECVALPHCVGIVTDLTPHLVRRALTSLRAELKYREELLHAKKAKDLLQLEERNDPDTPPALILVIDEFAALANDVEEFVDGVIDIAQRGRSLGIHLIMATQRPAGVIKDNLRANTNLRIALRMADESDSTDVIGSADAAVIDPSIPGRGVIKTGPGRLMAFQSAYAGGRTSDEPEPPDISIHDLGFGAEQPWADPVEVEAEPDDPGPNDQLRLVATITKAAQLADLQKPRRPWLDELSKVYDLLLLSPRRDTDLILGVADLPEDQQQKTVFFHPDVDGNLVIYGTGGSGKSVVLRTLAIAAGVTPRTGPVEVYALDFAAGGLRMLEQLQHVGAVINGDDTERVVRLLRRLRELADVRSQEFSALSASTITEYRALSGHADAPRILLLIDGFGAFRDQWEIGAGRAEWYGVFQQLLSEGRQLGIHVVFTADRPAAVPGAVASSVPRRVVLRMADDGMYGSLGVPGDVLAATSPPGRAIIDGLEAQIAILGGSTNSADQSAAIGRLRGALERQGRRAAARVESMPTQITLESLPTQADGMPVLGIAEDTLEPIGFEATGTFIVAGGPQSGRSTALAAMCLSLRRWDPTLTMVYLGNRRSALPSLFEWDHCATNPTDVAELARELAGRIADVEHDSYVIVVEALSEQATAPSDSALLELFKAVKRTDHMLIVESETSTWGSAMGLYSELKAGRRGIVLQPEFHEGDTILKTSFPRAHRREFPPGRGNAVLRGKVVRVQMPLV
ncbi:MAG: FtsK/SpoIIIE domain-containing protein [Nocardioides sp.]